MSRWLAPVRRGSVIAALWLVLSTIALPAQFLPLGTRSSRDADTWVELGSEGNHLLVLTLHRGDEVSAHRPLIQDGRIPLIANVVDLKWLDEDRIWIVTRAGRNADVATLFNFTEDTVEAAYHGRPIVFSPELESLAHLDSAPMGDQLEVNGVAVYPLAYGPEEDGLLVSLTADPPEAVPKSEIWRVRPRASLRIHGIEWIDESTLSFRCEFQEASPEGRGVTLSNLTRESLQRLTTSLTEAERIPTSLSITRTTPVGSSTERFRVGDLVVERRPLESRER